MKKLFALAAVTVFLAFGATGCVVEEDCECIIEDGPTCLNTYERAWGCSDDCHWDYVEDCDAECYADGYVSGYCSYGDCVCEYK